MVTRPWRDRRPRLGRLRVGPVEGPPTAPLSSRPASTTVPERLFQELDRRSLARDAAEHLKALIADGSLVPGQRLPSERALAAQLGISGPTLRQAVGALVIMGLLESRQGAGTFVAADSDRAADPGKIVIDISDDPLAALLELRLLLEPVAAGRAAARILTGELSELRRVLGLLEREQRDPPSFVRHDAEFHRQIHLAARSSTILAILDAIGDLGLRSRLLSANQARATESAIAEHRLILAALERHDAFEASATMTTHILQHARHIRASLRERRA